MLKRHDDQLMSRIDAVAEFGIAHIEWWELYLWYGMKRLSKPVWRDLRSRFNEANSSETKDLWIYESAKGVTFIHGDGAKKINEKIGGADE